MNPTDLPSLIANSKSASFRRANAHLLSPSLEAPVPAHPSSGARPALKSRPTPSSASPRPRHEESRSQQEVIKWWSGACEGHKLPEIALMAFPLQGKRSPANGARMKAEGMRRGTPDMLLAAQRGSHPGLWLEMKSAKGVLNPHQKAFLQAMGQLGYATVVCRSAQEARAAITAYLGIY